MSGTVLVRTFERRCTAWIIKVARHRLLHGIARTGQPQNNEKAHQSRNKIRIRYLPCATVMPTMATPPLLDEDDRLMLHLMHGQAAASTGTGSRSRQAFSSAANFGRTYSGIARRPISTAIIGAVPLINASSVVRSTP